MHDPMLLSMTLASTGLATAIGGLAVCLVLYLGYKLFYRADFGMPIRRRILLTHLRVRRDQFAEVPVWWSDLQVQRAVRSHWKQALRYAIEKPEHAEEPRDGLEGRGAPGDARSRAALLGRR